MAKRQSAYFKALQEANQTRRPEPVSKTADQPTVQTFATTAPARQQRIKATFYLTADDIIAIDTMQTQRFRQQGKKPEKSELVSEAVQLLFSQSNS